MISREIPPSKALEMLNIKLLSSVVFCPTEALFASRMITFFTHFTGGLLRKSGDTSFYG